MSLKVSHEKLSCVCIKSAEELLVIAALGSKVWGDFLPYISSG